MCNYPLCLWYRTYAATHQLLKTLKTLMAVMVAGTVVEHATTTMQLRMLR
jgi:hypothetical protein